MLYLNLKSFTVELKDGSIENVGPPEKAATAKLFDAEAATLRAFGDSQLKFVARDADGNEIQAALFPEQVEGLLEDAAELRADGDVLD